MKKIGCIIFVLIIFSSCSLKNELTIRVTAISNSDGNIDFTVYPENEYGDIVTGACVSVKDDSNMITYLDFSNENHCYKNTVVSNFSDFIVKIKSSLLTAPIEYEIYHYPIKEKPVFIKVIDSSGNDALNGDELNNLNDIQISWNNIGENVIYTLIIKSSINSIYSISTDSRNVIIPAATLDKNTMYFMYIRAENIIGDLEFEKANFYSVSKISSNTLSFFTE